MKSIKLNGFIALTEEELFEHKAFAVKFQNPTADNENIIAFYGNSNIEQRREMNQCFYNETRHEIEPARIVTKGLNKNQILNLSLITNKEKSKFIQMTSDRLSIYNFDEFITDKKIITHLNSLSDYGCFSDIKIVIFPFPYIEHVNAAIIFDNSIIDLSLSAFYDIDFEDKTSILIA